MMWQGVTDGLLSRTGTTTEGVMGHRARGISLAISAALLVTASTRAAAQSAQAFSVQVSGLYIGFGGSAYSEMSSGAGGEAQVRYTSGAMSLGLGYQYTRHTMEGEEGHMSNAGAFIEPRYVFSTSSPSFAPYVSA